MFKVKFVNDIRNVLSKKHRKVISMHTKGIYLFHNERIYILKRLSVSAKLTCLFHELMHWVFDKCCMGRMRVQYWWDMLWAYGSPHSMKVYRRSYQRMRERLPFTISGKKYKW